jgi:hypothetical protein
MRQNVESLSRDGICVDEALVASATDPAAAEAFGVRAHPASTSAAESVAIAVTPARHREV